VPDTYTGIAASSFDQTAYEVRAYYSLRRELYFDPVATVKPTAQSMNGSAVVFTIQSDLAPATTVLSESTDVSAVASSDTQVTLTLQEFGNAMLTTALLRGTTMIVFDPVVANIIGYNAGNSMDIVAGARLCAGTNVEYVGQAVSRASVIPTDVFPAKEVSKQVAGLRRAYVQNIGGYYVAFIHPDVSFDLRQSTGTAAWADPHAYSDPGDLWNGEVGTFAGVRFIEVPSPNLVIADAGSSTTNTDVYLTLFLGAEALAKAHSMTDGNTPLPTIVPGPVTDHLRRFVPMGWYWLGQYGIFRQAAIRRTESASSIGNNNAPGSN